MKITIKTTEACRPTKKNPLTQCSLKLIFHLNTTYIFITLYHLGVKQIAVLIREPPGPTVATGYLLNVTITE